jgi:hypothetical protein
VRPLASCNALPAQQHCYRTLPPQHSLQNSDQSRFWCSTGYMAAIRIAPMPSNAEHGRDQACSCKDREAQAVAAQQHCQTRSAGPCPGCWCQAGHPARHYGRQYGSAALDDVREAATTQSCTAAAHLHRLNLPPCRNLHHWRDPHREAAHQVLHCEAWLLCRSQPLAALAVVLQLLQRCGLSCLFPSLRLSYCQPVQHPAPDLTSSFAAAVPQFAAAAVQEHHLF